MMSCSSHEAIKQQLEQEHAKLEALRHRQLADSEDWRHQRILLERQLVEERESIASQYTHTIDEMKRDYESKLQAAQV